MTPTETNTNHLACTRAFPAQPAAHSFLWAGLLLIATGLMACERADREARFMSIGTGGTGGIYYVLGGAFASQLTQRDSLRQYTAEVTGASVENVNRIREGQLDLGLAMAITVYEAYHGGADYEQPVRNLRILAPLYPNMTHVMVRRGSAVQSVEELRGRRISVGSAGSGTEQLARHLFAAAGLGYGDIEEQYLTFNESAAALQDGAIDAAILSVGYPASAVLEATTTGGARLIPLSESIIHELQEAHPYYSRAEIPAGVYRGVTEPIATVSMMNWIVASEELPTDVVEYLLDILDGNRPALVQVHEMARHIDLNDLSQAPIPLHSATRWWLDRRP